MEYIQVPITMKEAKKRYDSGHDVWCSMTDLPAKYDHSQGYFQLPKYCENVAAAVLELKTKIGGHIRFFSKNEVR